MNSPLAALTLLVSATLAAAEHGQGPSGTPAPSTPKAEDHTPMPGRNMSRGMDSGMAMGNMNGMTMSPGMMAMGNMGFMNVMGSRAEPGFLMKLLTGRDYSMQNMGSMNGMQMGGMQMNGMDAEAVAAERANLSPAERLLVDAQEWCPITKMPLGSMGPPLKILLKGQPVFLCCDNCPEKARAEPDKTLADVAALKARKAQGGTTAGGMAMDGMGAMGDMNGMNMPRFTVSGWTDVSFTASSARQSNFPLGFNDRANQFLLQQNWLRIDYAIDEKSCSPSFGFRSDWILPGSDYRFTLARGIWNNQLTSDNGGPNRYGVDPICFYGEAYLPGVAQGMDLKAGRFCMLHGIDMNEGPLNLLPSHSYIYLADPFTHTGVLSTTKLTSNLVVQAGITTGSDIFFDAGMAATFVGGVKWTSPSQRTSLQFMTVLGPGRYDQAASFDNRNLFDVVLHQRLGECWYYSLEGLYGYENNVPDIGRAEWYGVLQSLTHEINSKLATTARLEFFNDVDGQRTFFPGLYRAATAGVWYRPRSWLTFRQEIRYDNSEGHAFEGRRQLFTATTDMILQW